MNKIDIFDGKKNAKVQEELRNTFRELYPRYQKLEVQAPFALIDWWENNRERFLSQPEAVVEKKPSEFVFEWIYGKDKAYIKIIQTSDGKYSLLEGNSFGYFSPWCGNFSNKKSEKACVAAYADHFKKVGNKQAAIDIWKAYNKALSARSAPVQWIVNVMNRTLVFTHVRKHVEGFGERDVIIMSGRYNRTFNSGKRENYYGEAICNPSDKFDFIEGCIVAWGNGRYVTHDNSEGNCVFKGNKYFPPEEDYKNIRAAWNNGEGEVRRLSDKD